MSRLLSLASPITKSPSGLDQPSENFIDPRQTPARLPRDYRL